MCYYFYEWDNWWNIENLDTEEMLRNKTYILNFDDHVFIL